MLTNCSVIVESFLRLCSPLGFHVFCQFRKGVLPYYLNKFVNKFYWHYAEVLIAICLLIRGLH